MVSIQYFQAYTSTQFEIVLETATITVTITVTVTRSMILYILILLLTQYCVALCRMCLVFPYLFCHFIVIIAKGYRFAEQSIPIRNVKGNKS